MPSLHTFVVTGNSYVPGPADPQVIIVGTVDGVPVTLTLWKSAYDQANAQGLVALEALVAPLMFAAFQQAQPPVPQAPVNQITGTFTFTI